MTDFFYCPRTELLVSKGDSTVDPTRVKELTVRDLLEHKVRAFGHPVYVENLGKGQARFVFRGADHNKIYGHGDPATNLLDGIVHLGTYYHKRFDEFVF
jgi:hypothetical protein